MQRREFLPWFVAATVILLATMFVWPVLRHTRTVYTDSTDTRASTTTPGGPALIPDPRPAREARLHAAPVADPAGAATRFKSAHDCLAYHAATRQLQHDLAEGRLDNLDELTVDGADLLADETSRFLHIIDVLRDSCQDTHPHVEEQRFESGLWEAALAGNADAQTCYVLSGPTPWYTGGPTQRDTTQLLQNYLTYAPGFTQNALERGDPRIGVSALEHHVNGPRMRPTPAGSLPLPDPLLTRRAAAVALRIAMLGQREHLQRLLQAFDRKSPLSPTQLQEAEQWAARHVATHYAGQSAINVYSPVACYARADLAP